MKFLPVLALVCLLSSTAAAHPGHGVDGGNDSAFHYLTAPMHLGLLVVVVGSVFLARRILNTRRQSLIDS